MQYGMFGLTRSKALRRTHQHTCMYTRSNGTTVGINTITEILQCYGTVYIEVVVGIVFREIVKKLSPRTFRVFNFQKYVAYLILRQCRLTR